MDIDRTQIARHAGFYLVSKKSSLTVIQAAFRHVLESVTGVNATTAWDAADIRRLLSATNAYASAIARQRTQLRKVWQMATDDVGRRQAQLAVIDSAIRERQAQLNSLVAAYKSVGSLYFKPDADRYPMPPATVEAWLQQKTDGTWTIAAEIQKEFSEDSEDANLALADYKKRAFGGRAWRAGLNHLGYIAVRLLRLRELRGSVDVELQQAIAERDRVAAQGRADADATLTPARALATGAHAQLPPPMQPWNSPAWADWASSSASAGGECLYAGSLIPVDDGDLGPNASFGSGARTPHFMSLQRNLELVYSADSRDQSLAMARSLLIRQLAATEPGDMRLTFFDPVGLGQSVADFLGLAEFDSDLIGGKVWSSPGDLSARLAELSAHIELVIQKYLRTTYETIDEFNTAAGEIAEPYRYLVICDFPTGFTEESIGQLRSVMANGPRCGVRTLLLTNSAVTPGFGVDTNLVTGHAHRISIGGNFVREFQGYTMRMRFEPEADPAAAAAVTRTVVDTVGHRSVSRTESAVTFDKALALFAQAARRGMRTDLPPAAATVIADDEATWWRSDSTRGLLAPIGQKGARDAAILAFDSGDHSGALLVGRPGSGKSTLLHTLIGSLTTLYSPRELELYLIDFKEGVEFKAYAEEGLPHARMVAIESDREFGLSVLQSLNAELSRRGELLRGTGGRHAGLQALREATGEALPRVLLVFDEFQVLFTRNDKLGLTAASLLETIIRQGRGFGIHVLLGSQSLSGLDALGAHVPQLLPVRLLLPATDADARKVLGDGNDAGQYLTTHGDGILNQAGGAVEANERFKGALLPEPERITRLRRLRARADETGFTRRPRVFEGNAAVPLDATDPAAFRSSFAVAAGTRARSRPAPVLLRAGVPMTTAAGADIELRREAGGNVLAVIHDDTEPADSPAYGLLAACVAAAACGQARIDVIDFMPADGGLDEVLDPLLVSRRISLRRRRALGPLIEELRKEVRARVENDDVLGPARVAFLFGIHRARELDAEYGSVDADPDLAEALEEVMRDGPETGVHVWIWSDSVSGAARRLSSRMMRECAWRIAGKMSADDSLALLGHDRAAEIRERQLVLSNDDRGVLTRAMSFSLPDPAWLARLIDVDVEDSHA